ncbi:MAG: hypothetical protein HY080_16000 [Gammaproteobacteria bacterium]|nr:hypothetical protein [Gammaproteobacteria bacterium]
MVYCGELGIQRLQTLVAPYGLTVVEVIAVDLIPGSFWGESEAGLVTDRLYVRADTPVHSALHEACHYICMDKARRQGLHTNAGGNYAEEDAVCYLQVVLAGWMPPLNPIQLLADMDSWGYSFRLGSARSWFEQDAMDARQWLLDKGLIAPDGQPRWQLRTDDA